MSNHNLLVTNSLSQNNKYEITGKNSQGVSDRILIGVNRDAFEVTDAWLRDFSLIVLVTRKING